MAKLEGIERIAVAQIGQTGVGVTISHVGKRYGNRSVLADVDLEISAGEFVAIVGHSGCGKSTLLRLISGLDLPTGGSIRIDGRAVSGRLPEVRMMFQDARLLPWRSVLDNVGIGLTGNWKAAAEEALNHVGLADRAGDWPSVLSGGQKQRVALARALVSHPKVLLLDEPLGALDALTRLEMRELIERVWSEQRFTAILVTHDVGEAVALADRVVVLERGRVPFIQPIEHRRPRAYGDAVLGEIEGEILARLLEKQAKFHEMGE